MKEAMLMTKEDIIEYLEERKIFFKESYLKIN